MTQATNRRVAGAIRLPKAACPLCDRTAPLRRNGEIREHRADPASEAICPGSGLTLEDAQNLADRPAPPPPADVEREEPTSPPPIEEPPEMLEQSFAILPTDRIHPSPANRVVEKGEALEGLAASIRAVGIVEPLVVAPMGDDGGQVQGYELIAGARRLAAAIELGMLGVPCIIQARDDQGRAAARAVENIQRLDLTPLQEAGAYQALRELGLEQEQIGAMVGVSQGTVSKRLALLTLPANAQELVNRRALSLETAGELARLGPKSAEQIVKTQTAHAERYVDEDERERDEMVAEWIESEVQRERYQRDAKAKRDAARRKAKAEGLTVLPDDEAPEYATRKSKVWIGRHHGSLNVKAKDHQGEPCHAVVITFDGTLRAVCTDVTRHRKRGGASELKGTVVDANRRGSSPAKTAEEKAAEKAQAELVARFETEAERREAFVKAILAKAVAPEDVTKLFVGWLLHEQTDYSFAMGEPPDYVQVAGLLGIDVKGGQDKVRQRLAEFAAQGPTAWTYAWAYVSGRWEDQPGWTYRVGLAMAILNFEQEVRELFTRRYFEWLERQGYEVSDLELERLNLGKPKPRGAAVRRSTGRRRPS
jgi:ParB family transcriptional regulator, chromosome partitioning protein